MAASNEAIQIETLSIPRCLSRCLEMRHQFDAVDVDGKEWLRRYEQ